MYAQAHISAKQAVYCIQSFPKTFVIVLIFFDKFWRRGVGELGF